MNFAPIVPHLTITNRFLCFDFLDVDLFSCKFFMLSNCSRTSCCNWTFKFLRYISNFVVAFRISLGRNVLVFQNLLSLSSNLVSYNQQGHHIFHEMFSTHLMCDIGFFLFIFSF
jgi:hypothetical protein